MIVNYFSKIKLTHFIQRLLKNALQICKHPSIISVYKHSGNVYNKNTR